MKDDPISKLTITETRHQATQYKKIVDTLPVLCADKNYQGIDDVIWNGIDLVEADFTPIYPDANLWSNIHHRGITSVNPADVPVADGSRTPTIIMEWRTYVFDTDLQKQILSEFKQNSKFKAQEFSKFVADKKASMTIIFEQYNEATKIETSLGVNYNADCQAGNLINLG